MNNQMLGSLLRASGINLEEVTSSVTGAIKQLVERLDAIDKRLDLITDKLDHMTVEIKVQEVNGSHGLIQGMIEEYAGPIGEA